jgi:hypothetical protein
MITFFIGEDFIDFSSMTFHFDVLATEVLVLVIVSSVWLLYKSEIQDRADLAKGLARAARVRNTASVFAHLLEQQTRVKISVMKDEILVGDRNAPIQIAVIANLYCQPCKDQHEAIEELINTFHKDLCVIFRFVESKDVDSNRYLIRYWLEHVHNSPSETEQTLALLHDWYSFMDLEKFKEKKPLSGSSEVGVLKCEAMLEHHKSWVQQNRVARTPTFFINGYEKPKLYDIADLAQLIPALSGDIRTYQKQREESELAPG